MRRAIARGRIFPQSYSTDRRLGKISLKACALLPLMWANADDQGRLSGEPDEIKYAVCPNIDHITKNDIPALLQELEQNELIKVYVTPKAAAVQILDWWDVQKPQWAWPSEYPSPNGWLDHLRYKKGAKEVVTFNWNSASPESSPENSAEASPEQPLMFPLTTPRSETETEKERERGNRRGRGRGNSPESSGEKSTPTLVDLPLLNKLTKTFPEGFGREPDSRELAQLRDLSVEISKAGGATERQVYDSFKEACRQSKFSVSYIRAVLCAWVGVEQP